MQGFFEVYTLKSFAPYSCTFATKITFFAFPETILFLPKNLLKIPNKKAGLIKASFMAFLLLEINYSKNLWALNKELFILACQ